MGSSKPDKGFVMDQEKESDRCIQSDSVTRTEARRNASENTLKAYEHAKLKLQAWLEGRKLTDTMLAEYIRNLYAEGKSAATINLVVAAVKWMIAYKGADYEVGPVTARVHSEIRMEGKKQRRRLVDGLAWDDVERMCAAAESSESTSGLRDAAMISLMSDCLLRISEAVAVNVEDVTGEGLLVRGGEEEQAEDSLYICEPTRDFIKRYQKRAGIKSGALFRRIRYHTHVTADRLGVKGAREAIQRWAKEAGIKGTISGQSLRIGSALSLAEAGATVKEMQRAGRWLDPAMPARYVREAPPEQSPVERYKDRK